MTRTRLQNVQIVLLTPIKMYLGKRVAGDVQHLQAPILVTVTSDIQIHAAVCMLLRGLRLSVSALRAQLQVHVEPVVAVVDLSARLEQNVPMELIVRAFERRIIHVSSAQLAKSTVLGGRIAAIARRVKLLSKISPRAGCVRRASNQLQIDLHACPASRVCFPTPEFVFIAVLAKSRRHGGGQNATNAVPCIRHTRTAHYANAWTVILTFRYKI